MSNTILTPTAVTREALRVLHQKSKFIRSINRQYDDRFAVSGAKIGETLTIRKPNQFTVRTGAVMQTQDITEPSTVLTVATEKGVDVNFSTRELTMSMDDFSKRILDPAMAVLAAAIEADALSMINSVANMVDNDANSISFKNILQAAQKLNENLAPEDDQRTALLSPTHNTNLVDALKGLFNNQSSIAGQYREGIMGHTAGIDFDSSSQIGKHTTGTAVATTLYTVNGATQSGATITVQTGTTTFLVGDRVTFAGAYEVHPETKVAYSYLKQFVITAASGTSATSLAISPSLTVTGAYQNVSAYPDNTGAVVKLGVSTVASATTDNSIVYHKDAFTFVGVDKIDVSQYGAWGSRQVFDGISMRIARDYDITNDKIPTRIDVMYGFKCIRPELACVIHADG